MPAIPVPEADAPDREALVLTILRITASLLTT
jgi:hypothetical protein